MRYIVTFFFGLCALFLSACQLSTASQPTVVVSSIQPIHLLVKEIAGDKLTSKLLLPANISPHQYTLRPSDLKNIQQAKVIFRIDKQFESFLHKALADNTHTQVVSLMDVENLHKHAKRDPHQHSHNEHEHHNEESAKPQDLHIWLNPDNGITMVKHIEAELSKLAPEHQTTFQANTKALIEQIQQTDKVIQQQLEPVKKQAYLNFHDSFQYFEKHYGLNFAGIVLNNLSHQLGARHLDKLQKKIDKQSIRCIFYEPQFPKRMAESLSQKTALTAVEIDPLGATLGEKQSYPQLLQKAADSFETCLKVN